MTTVPIRNDFHGTVCNLRIEYNGAALTPGQIKRCRRALCGIPTCTCGGILGQRGNQGAVDILDSGRDDDGNQLVTVCW
jgi:hypothetical protein